MPFFKKYGPRQGIIFSTGVSFVGFEVVNNEIGILATEDPDTVRELKACIAGKRGGVEEISGEQYLELRSQKKSNLKAPWRQEWQPRKYAPNSVGTFQNRPAAPAEAEQPAAPAPPSNPGEFRPKTRGQ